MGIIYVIWMYKLHNDLRTFTGNYPISADLSLLYLIVPFLSFYGIAKVHNTLAKKLGETSLTAHLQKPIILCLILWYVFHFFTSFLTISIDKLFYGWGILIIQDISFIILHVIILLGLNYISRGVKTLFGSSKNDVDSQPVVPTHKKDVITLRSIPTGNILKTFLYLILAVVFIKVSFLITVTFLPNMYLPVNQSWTIPTLDIACLFLALIIGIVYMIWIYKLHNDLRVLKDDYPISAEFSLISLIIPIFNLYGIAKIHYTIAKTLGEKSLTAHLQQPIVNCIILWYIFNFFTTVLVIANAISHNWRVFIFLNLSLIILHVIILLGLNYISRGVKTLFDSSKNNVDDQHTAQLTQ
jgi:large-conductance mechanosensitive channel